jgi:hypothetical protein
MKLPEDLHPTDILSAAKVALKHARIDRLLLNGQIGTSDAAITALVCGSISALNCTIPHSAQLCLTPDFSSDHLRIDLTGGGEK